MMPTVLRRSGPDILQRDGSVLTPRAMVHRCEVCGYEGAAFLVRADGRLLSYCGNVGGEFRCVHRSDWSIAS